VAILLRGARALDLAHQVSSWSSTPATNGRSSWSWTTSTRPRYADQIVALRAGEIVAAGAPTEIMTEAMVRTVFDLDVRVIEDPSPEGRSASRPARARYRCSSALPWIR
jgi:ABC-type cobalamin/Fe3+-siderophores transport system ATPase subunit